MFIYVVDYTIHTTKISQILLNTLLKNTVKTLPLAHILYRYELAFVQEKGSRPIHPHTVSSIRPHGINQQAPHDVERLGRTASSYGKAYFFFIAFRLLAWWAVCQGIVCALHDERPSENTLPLSSSKRIQ